MEDTNFYTLHCYNGSVSVLTIKEIFERFSVSQVQNVFGYGIDFGRRVTNNYEPRNFSSKRLISYRNCYWIEYDYYYYVTTNSGKLIHPNQLIQEYCERYDPHNRSYLGYPKYYSFWRGWKRKNRRVYRAMKTTAERRAVKAVLKEEGEPEFRGHRKVLPNKWDDYWIYYQRSWKTQSKRKRQYKGS